MEIAILMILLPVVSGALQFLALDPKTSPLTILSVACKGDNWLDDECTDCDTTYINATTNQCCSATFFQKHGRCWNAAEYQEWEEILIITLVSSQKLPTPNISATSV